MHTYYPHGHMLMVCGDLSESSSYIYKKYIFIYINVCAKNGPIRYSTPILFSGCVATDTIAIVWILHSYRKG